MTKTQEFTYGQPQIVGKADPSDHRAVYQVIERHQRETAHRETAHLRRGFPRSNPLVDVSDVAQAALNAWLEAPVPTQNIYDERIGHEFGDVDLSGLPYIAEPEINLHGIYVFGPVVWEVGEDRWSGTASAAVFPIAGHDGTDTIVAPYFIDEGQDFVYSWGIGAAIAPSLHMIPVGSEPRDFRADELDFAATAATYAQMAAAVVLLANSIANSDPRVVKVSATPDKVLKQARRKGRAAIDKTVTIELPGVKYEGKKWSGRRGDGVAWHMVRGHWRQINEERRTWVRPHSRGDASLGKISHVYRVRP